MEEKAKLDSLDKIYAISIDSYKSVLEIESNNERAILYMIDAYICKPCGAENRMERHLCS